ncbi:MAG: DUF1848 domain-containing protein [Spirochaetaceae bacterium]|jgi:hypothetical protein|nr:DUF1848 domain-containing protein [Spirochaetaceae bacterium]
MIISISRRGDIPRFQFEWFLERLADGFVDTVNPFNRNQVKRVSLLPDYAQVLVFWTRDPSVLLVHGKTLENMGYKWYCMTTLTGYPFSLETNPPDKALVLRALRELSGRFGSGRVFWRYDPVILSSVTARDFHLDNFRKLSQALKGAVTKVIISVYDEYPRAARRMARLEERGGFALLPMRDAALCFLPEVRELLRELSGIAREVGMSMQCCAEKEDLGGLGISGGACIDRGFIREQWGIEVSGRAKQREHCRCAPSIDIGTYGTCQAGCAYCYAR